MRSNIAKVAGFLAVSVILGVVISACASRTPAEQARVGAVAYSKLVHDIVVAEQTVYASKPTDYSEARHLQVRQRIRTLAVSAVVYDDVAVAIHDGMKLPAALANAQIAVANALTDLSSELPQVAAWKAPIDAAIRILRALIPASAFTSSPSVLGAQVVPPIFGLIALLLQLVGQGRIAAMDLVALFRKKGVTDDEINAAKGVLLDDIADIDEEAKNKA